MATPEPDLDLCYLRVSTTEQRRRQTILAQRGEVERYLEYARFAGVTWLADDGVKGDLPFEERPDGQRLLRLLDEGRVRTLVVWKIDRLGRNALEILRVVERVKDAGARLISIKESIDLATPIGAFFLTILAAFAQLDREWIADRMTAGRRARLESGRLIANYRPLYGYRWRDPERTAYDLDPETAPVVQAIYRDALAGRTLARIAADLTARAAPTPGGQSTWHRATVRNVLKHPWYTGEAAGWRWTQQRVRPVQRRAASKAYQKTVPRPPEDAVPLPAGVVPPLVDRRAWEAAQVQLRRNRERAARNNHAPESALLRGGFLRCGVCGVSLFAHRKTGVAPYYNCNVGHVGINVERADRFVWGAVERLVRDRGTMTPEAAERRDAAERAPDTADLDRRLAEVERAQGRLFDELAAFGASPVLRGRLAELEERRRRLEAERAEALRLARDHEARRALVADFDEWCCAIAGRIDALDYRERRAALDAARVRAVAWPVKLGGPRLEVRLGPPGGDQDAVVVL